MRSLRRSPVTSEITVVILIATAFAALVSAPGVPSLRHDWAWIVDRTGYIDTALGTVGGWRPDGIGSARPYPSDYLVALINVGFAFLFGSRATFVMNVAVIGLACSYAGSRLARNFSPTPLAGAAGALFTTFNPWVYTKLVAGHLTMLLAYSATVLLVAEAARSTTRPARIALLFVATAQQLQFFLLAAPLVAVLSVRERRWLPFLSGVIVASPSIAGLLLDRDALAGIPYNSRWQLTQSIGPFDALSLSGYFTKYADKLDLWGSWPVWITLCIALAGVAFASSRKVAFAAVSLALAAWLLATGERGPMAAPYGLLVVAFPATALFRELYDVLAYLAIAYTIGCALASARFPSLAVAWLACGLCLMAGWCIHSPWTFWRDARTLPAVDVDAEPATRFALVPGFQPLSYRGFGSGLDPDAYLRPGNVDPVNTPLETYPMNVALRDYQANAGTAELAALSVSEIVTRTGYRSNWDALARQVAIAARPASDEVETARKQRIVPLPELSLVTLLPPTDFAGTPGEGRIFFGDAALAGNEKPAAWTAFAAPAVPVADRSQLFASDGWVDARLSFLAHPEFAQGLGGVVTSSREPFPLAGVPAVLANVEGTLFDERAAVLSGTTRGYRWIALPPSLHAIRCAGICALAATGTVPAGLAARGAAPMLAAVPFALPFPWFVTARISTGGAPALLRYNVDYDSHWLALLDSTTVLPHVRIDSAVNGWVVPAERGGRHRLVLVESAALVQALCEVAAVTYLLLFVACSIRRAVR